MALETVTYIDDLVITNPTTGDDVSEGDNHLINIKTALKNTLQGLVGAAWRVQNKSVNYTAVVNDNMSTIRCTAALTLAFTAAATLGNKWMVLVYADGGNVTLDPNALETIGGATTKTIKNGGSALVACDGSNLHIISQSSVGTHTIWVPKAAMRARITNGSASGSVELSTNKVMLETFDFDGTTAEYAQFMIGMPKGWNESTVTFIPFWTGAAGAGGVVWRLSGVAVSDDDALDVAQGTVQTSTDTFIVANDLHTGPESAAITIGGSPVEGDLVIFEVSRNPADVNDTKVEDAKLVGIKLLYTINAVDDT